MNQKIALGFGNNIDYEIVWNRRVVEALVLQYGIRSDELNNSGTAIDSERDLLATILDFMRRGVGGERFVASNDIIEIFARRFDFKITLGGTPVRAAIAMGQLGHTAALHLITLNDDVRRLLPDGCPYVCSNAQDSRYPHLIVQYERGCRVTVNDIDIRAGASNRLIFHCNADNIAMRINEDFGDLIREARVMLVSGFNAVQGKSQLNERLDAVTRLLDQLPADALVFSEDAGNMRAWHYQLLFQKLGRRINIFSMNEDELGAHLGEPVDLLDAAAMLRALVELRTLIPAPTIVVHCRHWALAFGADAKHCQEALQAGVDLATTRFRHGDDVTLAAYQAVQSLPRDPAGAAFADAITNLGDGMVACAVVADVPQTGGTTIGLGDAFVGGFLPALRLPASVPHVHAGRAPARPATSSMTTDQRRDYATGFPPA